MPPKLDVKTFAGKLENAVKLLYELIEEFETILSVKRALKTLEEHNSVSRKQIQDGQETAGVSGSAVFHVPASVQTRSK